MTAAKPRPPVFGNVAQQAPELEPPPPPPPAPVAPTVLDQPPAQRQAADEPDADAIELNRHRAAAGPMDMGHDLPPVRTGAASTGFLAPAADAYDPDDGKTPDHLWVLDTTAKVGHSHEKRTHDMTVDGRIVPFPFEPDKRTKVPFPVALKFIRHPEFLAFYGPEDGAQEFGRVMDTQHGRRLAAGEVFALGADEVVAKFHELRQDALLARAMQLPGGERFKKNAPARDLADFITNHIRTERMREQQATRRREKGAASFGGGTMAVEDLDEDRLDAMFPKD